MAIGHSITIRWVKQIMWSSDEMAENFWRQLKSCELVHNNKHKKIDWKKKTL